MIRNACRGIPLEFDPKCLEFGELGINLARSKVVLSSWEKVITLLPASASRLFAINMVWWSQKEVGDFFPASRGCLLFSAGEEEEIFFPALRRVVERAGKIL